MLLVTGIGMQYHQKLEFPFSCLGGLVRDIRSQNFQFLEKQHPELAVLGGFAEKYIHSDPPSALVKLRTFSEQLLQAIFFHLGEEWPGSFYDALRGGYTPQSSLFLRHTEPVIQNLFHILRKSGNRAAHDHEGIDREARDCLQKSHQLAKWYYCTYLRGSLSEIDPFQLPSSPKEGPEELNKLLLAKEAELVRAKVLAQKERKEKQEALEVLARSNEEIEKLKDRSKTTIDALEFSEKETRKYLIDELLVQAGWDVGEKGNCTDEVGQEVELQEQGTNSGLGYADYVLYDQDGKPLAVIEAKKTSKDPALGLEQARQYAKALCTEESKRPIIFLTNGFDIFLYDEPLGRRKDRLWGFPSPDSLRYRMFQRSNRRDLTKEELDLNIAGRDEKRGYQINAVEYVLEHYQKKNRRALLALATGTGKTRIATSISEVLLKANWTKRILFLCDRLELRKQAKNTFSEFLKSQSATYVTPKTYKDRNHRLYFATYPSMIKCFENFDVGFFDLIIADESHRSIYNKYRDLFQYFDALFLGLTATPLNFIERNTFRLFECQPAHATFSYSLEEAIQEKVLVPPSVFRSSTQFSREGIHYNKLDDEQKSQTGEIPEEDIDYDVPELDRRIFNKDTNRTVLRNLMEHGMRDETGNRPGKSIIFARNHEHAVLLHELYEEMYADDYGDEFCKVIDYHDARASSLIDDFKNPKKNLTIAISVDMLDTGIDVPQIVNLSYAKPIGNRVKFLQMLGRGTRLCENLFGPGQHKKEFYVFDHWDLFEQFEQESSEVPEKLRSPSLLERLFSARLDLLKIALKAQQIELFNCVCELVNEDINELKSLKSIAVREHWKLIHAIANKGILHEFSAKTIHTLREEITPLMRHRDTRNCSATHRFDLLFTRFLLHRLQDTSTTHDLAGALVARVKALPINVSQVEAVIEDVKRAGEDSFWLQESYPSLEETRKTLRSLMYLVPDSPSLIQTAITTDITDRDHKLVEHSPEISKLAPADYRSKIQKALTQILDTNPVLQKIRNSEPVTQEELHQLDSLILTQSPDLDLNLLCEFFPHCGSLHLAIRSIIGLDPETVRSELRSFMQQHRLNARQNHFMELLIKQISTAGGLFKSELWEAPYTTLNSEGVDGIFPNEDDVDQLLASITPFEWPFNKDQAEVEK
jgi:type I restriction enzyme, R subunit